MSLRSFLKAFLTQKTLLFLPVMLFFHASFAANMSTVARLCAKATKPVFSEKVDEALRMTFFDSKEQVIPGEVTLSAEQFEQIVEELRALDLSMPPDGASTKLLVEKIIGEEEFSDAIGKALENLLSSERFMRQREFLGPQYSWVAEFVYDEFTDGKVSRNLSAAYHLDHSHEAAKRFLLGDHDSLHEKDINQEWYLLNLVPEGQENPAPTKLISSFDLNKLHQRNHTAIFKEGKPVKQLNYGWVSEELTRAAHGINEVDLQEVDAPVNTWMVLRNLSYHRRSAAIKEGKRLFIRIKARYLNSGLLL